MEDTVGEVRHRRRLNTDQRVSSGTNQKGPRQRVPFTILAIYYPNSQENMSAAPSLAMSAR